MQATYNIRRATEKDIPGLLHLLEQVNLVHHKGRPDLFNRVTKYGDDDLKALLRDEHFPVLVAVGTIDGAEVPLGHAFCQIIEHKGERLLADIRTLYIDDICVDERMRRMGVGKGLYEACLDLARSLHCKNVTLNVWACNPGACAFYTKMGMAPLKYGMEVRL